MLKISDVLAHKHGEQKKEKVYWVGTIDRCQACNAPYMPEHARKTSVMYDARTPTGQWGNICHSCFTSMGCSLGTGRGQKYQFDAAANKWYKVEG